MAQETIAFTQGIEMPPDILEQARQMKPAGFTMQMLPPRASAGGPGAPAASRGGRRGYTRAFRLKPMTGRDMRSAYRGQAGAPSSGR